MKSILAEIEKETGDKTVSQSLYFSPTAITHIKRLIETGGTILCDTSLVMNGIDTSVFGERDVRVLSFIDHEQVIALAEQKGITRAEVAVDYGLTLPGPKLLVIGSAPAALVRLMARRKIGPLNDVSILAAPAGFAGTVEVKEALIESDLVSIVVRGKKGGIDLTVKLINAILREMQRNRMPETRL